MQLVAGKVEVGVGCCAGTITAGHSIALANADVMLHELLLVLLLLLVLRSPTVCAVGDSSVRTASSSAVLWMASVGLDTIAVAASGAVGEATEHKVALHLLLVDAVASSAGVVGELASLLVVRTS